MELRRAEATKENLLRSIQSNEEEIRSFEDTRASYKAQIQAHLNAVHMLYRMEGQILCQIGDVQKSINGLQTGLKTTERVILERQNLQPQWLAVSHLYTHNLPMRRMTGENFLLPAVVGF